MTEREGPQSKASGEADALRRNDFHVSFKSFPPEFTQKVVETVIRGLSPLGESGREATVYLLEKTYNVRITDVMQNPKRFHSGLASMFGLGAKYLESCIIDEMTQAFDLHARPVSLSSAVEEASRIYMATEKRSKR